MFKLRLFSAGVAVVTSLGLQPAFAQSQAAPTTSAPAAKEPSPALPAAGQSPSAAGQSPSAAGQSPSAAGQNPPAAGQAPPAKPARPSRPWQPKPAGKDSPFALASVLPSGLRVLVAQDPSLPVAAVVLSVPSGTADDPSRNPGLVHALAYALQMGNRELSPGAALDEVYDSGGFAEMAVGVGQTRFESLVPEWSLKGVLRVEADRFSTPTLSEPLWLKSLQYAAQDRRPPHGPHRPLRALAFANPALLPDGRIVLPALTKIPLPALAQYLVQHFRLNRSTLAVVSNQTPQQTLKLVRSVFAKVDASARETSSGPIISAGAKGSVTSTNQKSWLLRPVSSNPEQALLAQILCEYLHHKGPTAPALACEYHASPTHPFLQIPAPKKDQGQALLKARLDALLAGQDLETLLQTAKRVQAEHRATLSSALTLARHLASLPNWNLGGDRPQSVSLASLRGELARSPSAALTATDLLDQMRQAGLLSHGSYRLAIAAPTPSKKKK